MVEMQPEFHGAISPVTDRELKINLTARNCTYRLTEKLLLMSTNVCLLKAILCVPITAYCVSGQ